MRQVFIIIAASSTDIVMVYSLLWVFGIPKCCSPWYCPQVHSSLLTSYVPHANHLSAVGKSAFPDVLSEAARSHIHASTHVQVHSGCALCSFLHFLCMSFEMYITMYMHVHTFWCAVHLSPHLHCTHSLSHPLPYSHSQPWHQHAGGVM